MTCIGHAKNIGLPEESREAGCLAGRHASDSHSLPRDVTLAATRLKGAQSELSGMARCSPEPFTTTTAIRSVSNAGPTTAFPALYRNPSVLRNSNVLLSRGVRYVPSKWLP